MKNLAILLVTFALVSFETLKATNNYNNTNGKSFTFNESGITFSIFQNGEFDFYLNQNNNVRVQYQTNNFNISFNSGYNYDAYLQYDNYGAIIQIQNTPIFYDHFGRVRQVGNIHINYNNGRVVRLGGMKIFYNNVGRYTYYRGYINLYNRYYVYHPYHNYFARPHYDYRVVSYKPYRHNYKATRYAYHNDHSKNKYYGKNGKHYRSKSHDKYEDKPRKSNSKRQRFATNSIPKRNEDYVATSSRRVTSSAVDLFKNDKSNYRKAINSSNKRTAMASTGRNNAEFRPTTSSKSKTIDRNSSFKRTNEDRIPLERRMQNNSNGNKHKPVSNQNSKKQHLRKSTDTKESKRTASNINRPSKEKKPLKYDVKRRSID